MCWGGEVNLYIAILIHGREKHQYCKFSLCHFIQLDKCPIVTPHLDIISNEATLNANSGGTRPGSIAPLPVRGRSERVKSDTIYRRTSERTFCLLRTVINYGLTCYGYSPYVGHTT